MPPNGCKGHRKFRTIYHFIRQPVQIHIRAHMHLSGTSLCQCCRFSGEIPSAPSSFAKVSALRRTILESLSNIGKAVDITERKIKCLELQYFISEKKRSLSPHKKYVIHYFSFCNRLATSPGIERSFLCITHTKPKEPVPPRSIWI